MRLVNVSNHSVDRARERWPDLPRDREQLRHRLASEVWAALAEHRYSTKLPRFAFRNGYNKASVGRRNGKERDRSLRYLWTPDEQRVYLIDRRGDTIKVITVMRPGETAVNGDTLQP